MAITAVVALTGAGAALLISYTIKEQKELKVKNTCNYFLGQFEFEFCYFIPQLFNKLRVLANMHIHVHHIS